jgi:EAL domain-containing protein (putative c-di-GMP-specific phosphodiesterase class I)
MLKSFGVDCVQGYYLEKPRADHPLMLNASRLQNAKLELRFT